MDLVIKKALVALAPGCCVNEIYYLLFDEAGQAMDNSTYTFGAYTAANHSDFAIMLTEDPQRTQWWEATIASGLLNIPATPTNQKWYLEFWQSAVASVQDRSADTLLDTQEFYWDGTGEITNPLSDQQLESVAVYNPQIAIVFDANADVFRYVTYLERNGILVTDSSSVTITWVERDNTPVYSVTNNTPIVGLAGVFSGEASIGGLTPDEVYPVKVEFTTPLGTYAGLSPVSVWD